MGRALTLAVLIALTAAAPAQAGPILDRAVDCLAQDTVCVDPGARDLLSAPEAQQVRQAIADANAGAFYVAVLPEEAAGEAGGSERELLGALHDQLGRPGTYALVVGRRVVAGSDYREVAPLADEAVGANRGEGLDAILVDFVGRVAGADAEGTGTAPDEDYSVNPLIPLVIVGGLLAMLFFFWGGQRRTRRRLETEQLEAVKREARDDLVVLGDDIRTLDLDIEMPAASAAAKDDYGRAVDLYKRAQDAFDTARRPEDLAPVASAVEEGRYYVASARARLEGRDVPERRPPCFFDPRHGPSYRDVEWSPPGGAPRPVPACEADAQAVERGLDPNVRQIDFGGQSVPYWNAPAYYGPWAGGFFGGFGGGGFLGGLLVGQMFSGGFGWGAPMFFDGGYYDGGGGDFGGGDFGGGDFGGGDFGGGDF